MGLPEDRGKIHSSACAADSMRPDPQQARAGVMLTAAKHLGGSPRERPCELSGVRWRQPCLPQRLRTAGAHRTPARPRHPPREWSQATSPPFRRAAGKTGAAPPTRTGSRRQALASPQSPGMGRASDTSSPQHNRPRLNTFPLIQAPAQQRAQHITEQLGLGPRGTARCAISPQPLDDSLK